jgi:xanthosine utilization system XapX-like protein
MLAKYTLGIDGRRCLVFEAPRFVRWWFRLIGIVPKDLPDEQVTGAMVVGPYITLTATKRDDISNATLRHEILHSDQFLECLVLFGILGFVIGLTMLPSWAPVVFLTLLGVLSMPILYGLFALVNRAFNRDPVRVYLFNPFEEEAHANDEVVDYLRNRRIFAWARGWR